MTAEEKQLRDDTYWTVHVADMVRSKVKGLEALLT